MQSDAAISFVGSQRFKPPCHAGFGHHPFNPITYRNLSFQPEKDFVPIGLISRLPYILVVNPAVPAKTLQELIALGKTKQGTLSFASPGNGHAIDNRARLATRIRQLKTGTRHSQTPVSSMRRVISNLVVSEIGKEEYLIESNFALFEMQLQSMDHLNIWAGRTIHKLRQTDGGLKMYLKKVLLVNGDKPLPTMAFLS